MATHEIYLEDFKKSLEIGSLRIIYETVHIPLDIKSMWDVTFHIENKLGLYPRDRAYLVNATPMRL